MKVFILGLGDTIQQYKHHENNITFGVNDIESYIKTPVDYLVCVNSVGCFTPQRQNVIKNSKPRKAFYTVDYDTIEWSAFHKVITLKKDYVYSLKTDIIPSASIDTGVIYSGMSSPFMAVQLAYRECPKVKEMYIYGVDLLNHWAFTGQRLDKELRLWSWLFKQLQSKGIKIVLPVESKLNEIL